MRQATGRVPGVDRALNFAVHEDNDRHVSERIANEGIWEPFETELVRRFLTAPISGSLLEESASSQHIFVDCGANLGWYSVLAGTLGAKVVACEPLPMNAALLRTNVTQNDLTALVEIHELALGSVEGVGTLRLSIDNQGDHRLVPSGATMTTEREEVEVPVRTLDEVLNGRIPTVMKIDTQGSEVAILRGGVQGWSRSTIVLILEFWPYGLERCGASADDLLDLLSTRIDVTHRCFEVVEWRQTLVPLSIGDLASMATEGGYSPAMKGFTNILLVPLDRLDVVATLIEGYYVE